MRFAERMKTRYGTIERANAAWGTVFEDFGDVARQTEFRQFPRLWPDYMEFMAHRYAEVLAESAADFRPQRSRPGHRRHHRGVVDAGF